MSATRFGSTTAELALCPATFLSCSAVPIDLLSLVWRRSVGLAFCLTSRQCKLLADRNPPTGMLPDRYLACIATATAVRQARYIERRQLYFLHGDWTHTNGKTHFGQSDKRIYNGCLFVAAGHPASAQALLPATQPRPRTGIETHLSGILRQRAEPRSILESHLLCSQERVEWIGSRRDSIYLTYRYRDNLPRPGCTPRVCFNITYLDTQFVALLLRRS
jgi:hypothetical protein